MGNAVEAHEPSPRKAWFGNPPGDDDEARERIIQAAKDCIARGDVSGANISAVAKMVGVTRRTIYRLFESTEHLIRTVALESTGHTLNRMIARVNTFDSFQERTVEAIIFLVHEIPRDPVLSGYFSAQGNSRNNSQAMFSTDSLEFSFQMLKMLFPGSTKALDETLFRQLAEHMQRLILALILTPSTTLQGDAALRQYLERWFVPAMESTLGLPG